MQNATSRTEIGSGRPGRVLFPKTSKIRSSRASKFPLVRVKEEACTVRAKTSTGFAASQVIFWRVEYGETLRAYVEKVGWSGENLKIAKHSPNDAKKKWCLNFYLRAASSSNPASKIAILAKIAILWVFFTLGGILHFSRNGP